MNYKLFTGVVFAVATTMAIPVGLSSAWAAEQRALASDGADHVGAGQVASDGSDHVGAGQLASDGSDRVGAPRLAYSSRVGVGSDRVASNLMSGSYTDQFNAPR